MKTLKKDYYYAKDSLENTQEILRRMDVFFKQAERLEAKADEAIEQIEQLKIKWEK